MSMSSHGASLAEGNAAAPFSSSSFIAFLRVLSVQPFGLARCVCAAVALATLPAATGCGKSEAATLRHSAGETAAVTSSKSETETYVAEIKSSGGYKAGAEGTVEVTLVPKGGYHTNAQYPYKFKAADPAPDGVTFPKPVLQRADGSFEEKRGSFKVPFVAAKSGSYTVSGTLSMSVCSDANCIMDKVPLEVTVDVR